jgi:mannose-6-phosphate isomerase-like protein (cupin superfamily)
MSTTTPSKDTIKPIVLHNDAIAVQSMESFPEPSTGGTVTWKTLISQPNTPTNTFTVGIAACSPQYSAACDAGYLQLHRHTHAEIYHVISGRGIVSIEGVEHLVGKGSVVFIPGDAEHGVRCEGEEELRWLYVFAADGFGKIEYRFGEPGLRKRERTKL